MVVAHECDAAAARAVRGQGGVGFVLRVEQHGAVGQFGQRGHAFVGRVQHGRAVGQHDVDLAAHDVVQRIVVAHVQVGHVGRVAHVRHDADEAAVVRQAFGQDRARVRFEHGGLHGAVDQEALAGVEAGAVLRRDLAAVEEQALAVGDADVFAGQVQHGADEARGQCRVERARDAHERDAARLAFGEQMLDDGLAHVARLALGGLDVREQARAGIDFDDGAALLLEWTRDVFAHEVDAGDVQAHDARGQPGHVRDFRMDLVGDVVGHVAVQLDQHFLAGLRHRIRREALAFQVQLDFIAFGRHDGAEREFFGIAAARIDVDLAVAQLRDGGLSVADDPQRFAFRGRDDFRADDEQAVFVAGDEALDEDGAGIAFLGGDGVGGMHVRLRHQVQRHAAAMVAVDGLDGDGQADVLRFFPRRCRAAYHGAFRHRHAARGEQGLGEVLVAGDGLADGARAVRLGRPDAALRAAVAQLHEVAFGQADRGDAAVGGGVDDVAGRRAQAVAVDQFGQFRDLGLQVEGRVVDGGHQQRVARLQGRTADGLVARAERHLINAMVGGGAGLAEAGLHAGQVLQFEDDVFEDVAGPGAVAQALQEAAPFADAAAVFDQTRQPGGEAFIQAGKFIRRTFFEFADVEPRFDDRAVGPDVRSTQVVYTKNCNVFLICHENIQPRDDRSLIAWHCLSLHIDGQRRCRIAAPSSSLSIMHMLYTCRNEAYRAEPISATLAPSIEYRTLRRSAFRKVRVSTGTPPSTFHRTDQNQNSPLPAASHDNSTTYSLRSAGVNRRFPA